eukprot:1176191-Prorocentrum_minimum.AAC.2
MASRASARARVACPRAMRSENGNDGGAVVADGGSRSQSERDLCSRYTWWSSEKKRHPPPGSDLGGAGTGCQRVGARAVPRSPSGIPKEKRFRTAAARLSQSDPLRVDRPCCSYTGTSRRACQDQILPHSLDELLRN